MTLSRHIQPLPGSSCHRLLYPSRQTTETQTAANARRLDDSEFRFWSGARDLNPRPHGPEIWAVSSTEIDFARFEVIS
jgi:hypothetical protein